MRKLASIRIIKNIEPIEDADAIMVATVDDWKLVVKKDEFKIGDRCVYFEIDSLIPLMPQVEHLRSRAYKKMGDKEGIRIKTIKLRGQISQGLALPVSSFIEKFIGSAYDEGQELSEFFFVGNDVTDFLGVLKYEPPIPSQLAGNVRGNYPSCIKKTDQERCQNLGKDIFIKNKGSKYEVTMKLNGTSFTGFFNNSKDGVCSRNWELDLTEENRNNMLIRMYIDSGLQTALHAYGKNIAIQGELMGPGIQGNQEGFEKAKLFIFDIYDIDNGCHFDPEKRVEIMKELINFGLNTSMVGHVPIFAHNVTLEELGITDVTNLLSDAEGPSIVHPIREGKVYKRMDGKFSFKAISNHFLLKSGD